MQLLTFALCFMSSWEVVAMNIGASFYNGGPQALVWGMLLVVAGALALAASMAELASIQPIAGAQYHWTKFLMASSSSAGKERQRARLLTWMQGWVTWFAWVSSLAGSTSSMANILLGLVTVNHSEYVYRPWHLTLLIVAQLLVVGAINVFAFRSVPWLETIGGALHVIIWIIFIVVFAIRGGKSDASFVFFERSASSGWTNGVVSWNLGLLVTSWGFVGFDGVVHMSEEVRRAKHAVPRAMIWTIILNSMQAYSTVLVLLFAMGDDASEILNSPYPIIPLCFHAVGQRAGTAMVISLLVITFCVVTGSLASVSRITWAWARDRGLPPWFAKIHPVHRVPVRSTLLPIAMVSCLALFTVGNTATSTIFSAFTSLSMLGLYSSYIIAIGCMVHARLSGRIGHGPEYPVQFGDWTLPRGVGLPLNIYALAWSIYVTIWLPFPTTLPVTGANMNYSGPIYLAVILGSIASWILWGKNNWPGLNSKAIEMVRAHD